MPFGAVICVDPDEERRATTVETVRDAGFDVRTADSVEETRSMLATGPIDAVVTEYDLPDGTGLDLVEAVRSTRPDAACILYTAATDRLLAAADGHVLEFVDRAGDHAAERLLDLLEFAAVERPQTAYPLPDDEQERLDAVEQYAAAADLAADSLERLANVAAAALDVPRVAIGIVDEEEERFVARYGADVDTLPRESTVCTYAILEDEATVIPDLREDPRFANDPALREANIRFYASGNLTDEDDRVIGAFCLFDDVPRSLSDRERRILEQLADQAMETIDLHRQIADAAERERLVADDREGKP